VLRFLIAKIGIAATVAVFVLSVAASAQDLNPITLSLKTSLPSKPLKPGDTFEVHTTAKIQAGWHLYSLRKIEGGPIPTRITVPEGQPFELGGEIKSPDSLTDRDPNFGVDVEFFEEEATFTLPIKVKADALAGKRETEIRVRYQTCNDKVCLPPKVVKLTSPIELVGAVATQTPSLKAHSVGQTASAKTASDGQVLDFEFTDFDGNAHRFSEFRGHVVLIDFWATWCKPCLADIPHLKELYAKYRDKGFEIIGMDSETLGQDEGDNDPAFAKERDARARQIVATRGASWTHATAATAVPVAEKVFKVKSLPTKILIDAQGKIVARVEEGAGLDQMLAKLLGGKQ
jgi:thiol-disulfide isomerase/thioredoxin